MTWLKFEAGIAIGIIAGTVYVSKFWEKIPPMLRLTKRASKCLWRFITDVDFFGKTPVQNDDGVVVQMDGRRK